MADILKILLIILGILIVYVSYWLLSEALFPGLVSRAAEAYRKPVKLTLVGLAAALAPVVLGIVLSKLPNPLAKLAGLTLMIVPGMLGLAGSAGLTMKIGAGLPVPEDVSQPWRRVLRGGTVLACSFLLPVVGWFIIPIWVLVSGFGAFILCARPPQPHPITPVPPPLESASPIAG